MTPTEPLLIQPSRGWRSLQLGELWQYRELLYIFAWRDLKVRYRQTLLGAIWIAGQPLVSMIIFTLIFHNVAHFQADVAYPLFVFSGLVIWNFVVNSITKSGNSLIGSSPLISKVYFPRLVIPLSNVVSELVDFAVAASLLAVMMIHYGARPGASIVLLPVPIALAMLLAVGTGLWVAALNVEYRDVRVVIPFILQIGMYVTPVVYPLAAIPERYRRFALLNPMTGIVQTFRATLFDLPIPTHALAWSAFVSLLLAVSGAFYFRRMERLFADIL